MYKRQAEGGRLVFEVGAYYLCAVKHEEVELLEQMLLVFQDTTQVFRKAAVNAEGTLAQAHSVSRRSRKQWQRLV